MQRGRDSLAKFQLIKAKVRLDVTLSERLDGNGNEGVYCDECAKAEDMIFCLFIIRTKSAEENNQIQGLAVV